MSKNTKHKFGHINIFNIVVADSTGHTVVILEITNQLKYYLESIPYQNELPCYKTGTQMLCHDLLQLKVPLAVPLFNNAPR
jgi:hypothetical protein